MASEVDTVQTTPQALRRAARLWPDAEAIADVQDGRSVRLTWTQLLTAAREFGAGLVARGVARGDRVAIWAPNTHEWVVAQFGAQFAGATVVPVNSRYTAVEALDLLQRSGAATLVVVGEFLGTDRLAELGEATDHRPGSAAGLHTVVVIDVDGPSSAEADVESLAVDALRGLADESTLDEVDARAHALDGGDIADILYTSGTTGRSKGVVTTHRATLAGARGWGGSNRIRADDRYLMVNPYFHSFGYKAGILVSALYGATMVPLAVYSPTESLRLVAAERITVLPGAPTIFQTLLDAPDRTGFDLSSLRIAVTGASIVPVVLVERMQSELGLETVVTAYGLTECPFVTTCTPGDDDATVATTCGRPFPGLEVRLGEKDEVLVRGEAMMSGYLDDPDATADAIDADGWLRTGDVGEFDDAGNLRITDRLKDMYISGGFNVYPAEIEQTLARLDGIVEAAVIGVPDSRLGEVGRAFVVRREDSDLTEEQVLDHCRENLANFKRPRAVEFLEFLPRNPSGKVVKPELR